MQQAALEGDLLQKLITLELPALERKRETLIESASRYQVPSTSSIPFIHSTRNFVFGAFT